MARDSALQNLDWKGRHCSEIQASVNGDSGQETLLCELQMNEPPTKH